MSLIINNLNKKFGRNVIFENFSYTFNTTGLYVITGNSGRGKTTLLRIIAGLDNDYSGQVTGGGIGNISMHFQEYRLFENLTVLENITKVSKHGCVCVDKAKDLLMSLGINDNDLNKYPNELSGGMKMRVSFARAVLKDAPVLLLDEALKELDINSITAICHVIEEEAKKRLVILVTHKVYPDLFGQFNEISLQ